MAAIHVYREHQLGLDGARVVAQLWGEGAAERYAMTNTIVSSTDEGDEVAFNASGVNGTLSIRATHFEIKAETGFMMAAFAPAIQAQIEKSLDKLIERHTPD